MEVEARKGLVHIVDSVFSQSGIIAHRSVFTLEVLITRKFCGIFSFPSLRLQMTPRLPCLALCVLKK